MIDITALLEQFSIDPTLLINWGTFIVMILISSLLGYQAMKVTGAFKAVTAKWLTDEKVPMLSLLVSFAMAGLGLALLVPLGIEFTIIQIIAFIVLAGANIDQKSSKHFQIEKLLGNVDGLSDIKKKINEDIS